MSEPVVTLSHGAGGAGSQQLLHEELLALLAPAHRVPLEDAALLPLAPAAQALVVTTDGFVVQPLVFPGGDLGKLAVCGTVNDLAMRGARPLAVTVGLILEEGLPLATLRRVVSSLSTTAAAVGVPVIAGDTKVVARGQADGMFVSMTGVGTPVLTPPPSAGRARPGDQVVISGNIGDHGIAVLAARAELGLAIGVHSDCAPLWSLVATMVEAAGDDLHVLRDPTRGGVAAALNEIAEASGVGIVLQEASLPIAGGVRSACELLGFDPLALANEGKVLGFVAPGSASVLLAAMRRHPLGAASEIIGEVIATPAGRVVMETPLGVRRLVDMPTGELVPRIC